MNYFVKEINIVKSNICKGIKIPYTVIKMLRTQIRYKNRGFVQFIALYNPELDYLLLIVLIVEKA